MLAFKCNLSCGSLRVTAGMRLENHELASAGEADPNFIVCSITQHPFVAWMPGSFSLEVRNEYLAAYQTRLRVPQATQTLFFHPREDYGSDQR